MPQLYKMVQRREWLVDFDYCKRAKINLYEEPVEVIRRSFLINKEHVDLQGSRVRITENDIGRVFLIEEFKDGSFIDYILDAKMHPSQWKKYGGFKLISE